MALARITTIREQLTTRGDGETTKRTVWASLSVRNSIIRGNGEMVRKKEKANCSTKFLSNLMKVSSSTTTNMEKELLHTKMAAFILVNF